MSNKIAIYKSPSGQIKLKVDLTKQTIWLTQKQLSQLFDTDRSSITKHLNNIFKSKELDKKSNVQKMHIPNSDKPVNFYNLDAIISLGYRVNSKKATQFRIWATNILKKYITKGYVVNQTRLAQLQKTIKLITTKSKDKLLQGHETEVIDLINSYSSSFQLLKDYDSKKIKNPKLNSKPKKQINNTHINKIISQLKKQFPKQSLLGQPYPNKLQPIIANINQTFDNKQLYPSIEEKAANLLYIIIKDHPFVDGNKRIASASFIYFLSINNYLLTKDNRVKINDKTLTALSLLIATSQPNEKDIMINLTINLIHQ